jgi:hypothetical protein
VRTDLLVTTHTGVKLVVVNSYELQHEVSDDSRFKKVVVDTLAEIRRVAGDGLFTSVLPRVVACTLVDHSDGLCRAHLEEPNWEIARKHASVRYVRKNLYSLQLKIAF